MNIYKVLVLNVVFLFNFIFSEDLKILQIEALFNKGTPGFGSFTVVVTVTNQNASAKGNLISCMYVGFNSLEERNIRPPIVFSTYKFVEVNGRCISKVYFTNAFNAFHPEFKGEIIGTVFGTGNILSKEVVTSYHPKSSD